MTAGLVKGLDVATGNSQKGNTGLGCSLGDIGAEGPPTSLAWLPRGFFLYYHDMVAPELWVSARLGQVHAGMERGCESDLRPGVWRA